jgi:hypothetical protein
VSADEPPSLWPEAEARAMVIQCGKRSRE